MTTHIGYFDADADRIMECQMMKYGANSNAKDWMDLSDKEDVRPTTRK